MRTGHLEQMVDIPAEYVATLSERTIVRSLEIRKAEETLGLSSDALEGVFLTFSHSINGANRRGGRNSESS